MNQEYILLAGWYWLLSRQPVYLWRNHYAGSLRTDIAAAFCTKVFCTSRHSYTAKYRKTVRMPVGTDARVDSDLAPVVRKAGSVLSLGRISPSKNIHIILEALGILNAKGIDFSATIRGKTAPEDSAYRDALAARARELGMESKIVFGDAVPKNETTLQYRSHEVFVNASPSGMLDKTIFSAMTYGCIVLASSRDFAEDADPRCVFGEGDARSLAAALENMLALPQKETEEIVARMSAYAADNTLTHLAERLRDEIV